MGRNVEVEKHNKEYLTGIIAKGKLSECGREYRFRGLDKDGEETGYLFVVDLEVGTVVRINENQGECRLFGLSSNSRDARGYMTVEMVTPYEEELFIGLSVNNIYTDDESNIVGVQYTCYIHSIIGIIKGHLNNTHIGRVSNHMNGLKLDNSLKNIETCTDHLNLIHGAVFTSMVHHNRSEYRLTSGSNKAHTFPALIEGISAYWVEEYRSVNVEFDLEIEAYNKSIKAIKKNNGYINYIDSSVLIDFVDWLVSMKYWKVS